MKLAWLFGSSMEARHLLAAYAVVWLVQSGYAVWIALQWRRTGKELQPGLSINSESDEDS